MIKKKKTKTKRRNRLLLKDRKVIEKALENKETIEKIAKKLKRSYHTILFEINRNSSQRIVDGKKVKIYSAITAQEKYEQRHTTRTEKLKQTIIQKNKIFIELIQNIMIKEDISPMLALKLMEEKFPNVERLSYKTVYNYIEKGIIKTLDNIYETKEPVYLDESDLEVVSSGLMDQQKLEDIQLLFKLSKANLKINLDIVRRRKIPAMINLGIAREEIKRLLRIESEEEYQKLKNEGEKMEGI